MENQSWQQRLNIEDQDGSYKILKGWIRIGSAACFRPTSVLADDIVVRTATVLPTLGWIFQVFVTLRPFGKVCSFL